MVSAPGASHCLFNKQDVVEIYSVHNVQKVHMFRKIEGGVGHHIRSSRIASISSRRNGTPNVSVPAPSFLEVTI